MIKIVKKLLMINNVQIQIAVIETMNIIRHYTRSHQEIHLTHLVGYVTAKSSNEDMSG